MTLQRALAWAPILACLFLAACNPGGEIPPLIAAARSGRAGLIPALVKEGADPNARWGVNHWNVLEHAIHKRQPAAVQALLDAGADVNARGGDGLTPLMMAAGYGYDEIVNALLDRGADPRATLPDGLNALTLAVLGVPDIDRFTLGDCQVSTVKALLRRAPDLKLSDSDQVRRVLEAAKWKGCAGYAQFTGRALP